MTRCPRCQGRLVCPRCTGRRGGRAGAHAAKKTAWDRMMLARWNWKPGERVTARIIKKRTWVGDLVSVGPGRRGRRVLTVLVTHAGTGINVPVKPYRAEIRESLAARAR